MTPRSIHLLVLTLLLATPPIARAQPAPAGVATTQGLAATVQGGHAVRRGDTGTAVRELQLLLARHGHAVVADGDFGPGTDAAVRAFQRARSMPDDGLVGPATLAALQSAPTGGGVVGALGGAPASARPPSASTAPADVYAAALPWARAANAAGRHTLVIVFEGQLAYSAGYTGRIYDYQEALRAGQSPSRPIVTGLSFVSSQLIVPNLGESQRTAELLILPEYLESIAGGGTSVAEEAGRAWHDVHGAAEKILVVGHSLGGWSAIQCGNRLARHQIPVASMLTVDPRVNNPYFIKPRNVVGVHANYYQKSPIFPGYEIQGAVNVHLHVNHAQIPGAPEVVASYLAMLRS